MYVSTIILMAVCITDNFTRFRSHEDVVNIIPKQIKLTLLLNNKKKIICFFIPGCGGHNYALV